MAQPREPSCVKLICGALSSDVQLLDAALGPLTAAFGPADLVGQTLDFIWTEYYDAQMGHPLYRRFVSFENLVRPDFLVQAKLHTNRIEDDMAAARDRSPPRPINLDPGYIEESKLVLASMKNFSHRIYLSQGVYAEVTLLYRKGRWESLEWTFPDYASGSYDAFLTAARDRLRERKNGGSRVSPCLSDRRRGTAYGKDEKRSSRMTRAGKEAKG